MELVFSRRKGVDSVIATVLIVAATLMAAVAVGGFVFGLLNSSVSTAQVQVTSIQISATITSAGAASVSCATSAPASNFVTLTNSGEASATVRLVVLQFGGATDTYAPTGTCVVPGGGILYLSIGQLTGATPAKGDQFSGYAAFSNGAQAVFAGAFT